MQRVKVVVAFLGLFLWFGQALSLGAQPPPQPLPMPPISPISLVQSFEELLGRQAHLLHSFEWLLKQFHVPPAELVESYEELLHHQTELLQSFEGLARPFVCTPFIHPKLKLIASLEKLLQGQVKLLTSFEALLSRLPPASLELLRSFEGLLKSQAELIQSFEGLLHCLVEVHRLPPKELYQFMLSFEELLKSQAGLLKSFEELIRPDPVLKPAVAFLRPEGRGLPSLEELRDLILKGEEMLGREALIERFIAQIRSFKQEILALRARGLLVEVERRESELAEFRRNLTKLQHELLQQNLLVQLRPQALGTFQVLVENRGPFTVTMASLLLREGSKLIFSQSLGTLEPGARRTLMVRISAPVSNIRAVATGFLELIAKLLGAALEEG